VVHGLHHLLSTGSRQRSTLVASLPTLKDPAHFSKQRFGLEQKHFVFLFKPKSPPLSVRTPVPERSLVEPLGEARRSRGVVPTVARAKTSPKQSAVPDRGPPHFRMRMRNSPFDRLRDQMRMNKKTYHLLLTTNYQTTTLSNFPLRSWLFYVEQSNKNRIA
jgi:hypothetical protein